MEDEKFEMTCGERNAGGRRKGLTAEEEGKQETMSNQDGSKKQKQGSETLKQNINYSKRNKTFQVRLAAFV